MTKNQLDFLDLFFDEGEEFCVSDVKYSFKSVPRDDIEMDNIELQVPPSKQNPTGYQKIIQSKDILLCSINPIIGAQKDANVQKYRSFMVEIDGMELKDQQAYIEKQMQMPFSVCVYSGGKSLHYGIVLDPPLSSDVTWHRIANWITNIIVHADSQNNVPSRRIRFPDNMRVSEDGKRARKQSLVKLNGRIPQDEFYEWLQQYSHLTPPIPIQKTTYTAYYNNYAFSSSDLKPWMVKKLEELREGSQQGSRNTTWYSLACNLAEGGVSLENIYGVFSEFFVEESDFSQTEWERTIKSAYDKKNK